MICILIITNVLLLLSFEIFLFRQTIYIFFPNSQLVSELFISICLIAFYLYVLLGGFKGTLINDFYQFLVILMGFIIVAHFSSEFINQNTFVPANAIEHKLELSILPVSCDLKILTIYFGTIAFIFCWITTIPDLWTKTFGTLKSVKRARVSLGVSLFVVFFSFNFFFDCWSFYKGRLFTSTI